MSVSHYLAASETPIDPVLLPLVAVPGGLGCSMVPVADLAGAMDEWTAGTALRYAHARYLVATDNDSRAALQLLRQCYDDGRIELVQRRDRRNDGYFDYLMVVRVAVRAPRHGFSAPVVGQHPARARSMMLARAKHPEKWQRRAESRP